MTTIKTQAQADLRRQIHRLEDQHRDAVSAYIRTKRAEHQRRMVELSRALAGLRAKEENGS